MLGAGLAKINNQVQNSMHTAVNSVQGRSARAKTDPHEFLKAWQRFKQYMEEFNKSRAVYNDDDVEQEMEEFFSQ